MSPALRLGISLPNTPVRNSCSPVILDRDEDTQTVYTEVDFDTIAQSCEQRVPHHFVLLEEPSTTASTTTTSTQTTQLQRVIGGGSSGVYAKSSDDDLDDGDAATVSDLDAIPFVRLEEQPSNNPTTQLQRLIGGGGGSSGVYANRGDDDGAATVFTEVDFGLEKNPNKSIGMQKSRLLDITETVKLQNISEQQELGSNSNLPSNQCRRRRTPSTSFVNTTDSPRKTKVAESVKQKQPRKSSMSKEYIDDFHVWSDHEQKELGTEDHVRGHVETTNPTMAATHDNHRYYPGTPLRSQRKQVMSELLVTQSELQQKQRRAPPQHRQSPSLKQRKKVVKEELMPGDGGRRTPIQSPTRMDRMTATRPTPPRPHERVPSSPQKRRTRQSLKQRPMLNEKVAGSKLRAENLHTHEWDAFPDDNVEYQNGCTTNLEASFSASFAELASELRSELVASNNGVQDPDNLDFNASFSDIASFSDLATGGSSW
jgi:hypothetical protein